MAEPRPGRGVNTFDPVSITTRRLVLTPLRQEDAERMVDVLGDERLHEFIGGHPANLSGLHRRYGQLVTGSPDPQQIWLNWIVRRRADGEPIGTVQATVTCHGEGRAAEVAWVIGVPWQGQGFATDAAGALVDWLQGQGANPITANVHPDHHASAKVAARAGLSATEEEVDGERVWRLTGG